MESFKTSRSVVGLPGGKDSFSIEVYEPSSPRAVMTVGHGAGTNMDHQFLKKLCAELAALDIATIRFNFLYTERGRKMPDRFPAAAAVVNALFTQTVLAFPTLPVFGSGKSFGGRMTSMTLAEFPNVAVKGIVFFGFPLHPAGSPSVERATHLQKIQLPLLFLQGTRDELATMELLETTLDKLPLATLIRFEGADHSFKGGKQTSIQALAQAAASWITDRI
jgi:uncharacterized protein